MQFVKRTITIATKDGPEDIEAIVDESIMKYFIENIADLLDWHQKDPQSIVKQGNERYPNQYGVYYELKRAFDKACEQATAEIKQRIAAQEITG